MAKGKFQMVEKTICHLLFAILFFVPDSLLATPHSLFSTRSAEGWGRSSTGLKRKPESVRKQEGNTNVITLSRFLWLEQWRCRQRWRPRRAALGMGSEEESILGRGMSPKVSGSPP